jgi:hypothetical protein
MKLFSTHCYILLLPLLTQGTGMTRTEVENMHTHLPLSPPQLQKEFLRMELPIYDNSWDTNILKPGKTYRIRFKFVVPEELPIQACHHQCAHDQIKQQHLQLPASLSYRTQNFDGSHHMSPEMAEVRYSINFAVWQRSGKTDKAKKVVESTYPLQIIPIRDEHAPILVPAKSKYYQLQSEKTLSRGVMRHTVGKLAAYSAPPPAIQTHGPQPQMEEKATALKIILRFEPVQQGELPPAILSAQFQLRAMTFFGLDPWSESPDLSDISTWGPRRGFWSEDASLSPDNEVKVEWKAGQEDDRTIFTALLETRVTLPSHRRFPPTFHSCLVSRTYALKSQLLYQGRGRIRGSSSISLSVPVEICAL